MKKIVINVALTLALLGVSAAQAGEFEGSWVGGKIGSNTSGMTGVDRQNATSYGLEGGHNWDMGGFLLGVDGFIDVNDKTAHNPAPSNYGSNVYGVDAKLGIDAGKWLPYAKIGYARTDGNGTAGLVGGSDAHLAVGVEYKFAPSWSVSGEFSSSRARTGATRMHNNNLTLGLSYYFGAPAPVAAPAPLVQKEEPEAAPVPQPVPETWKTLLENKPVCIEGANFEFDSAKLRSIEIQKLDEVVSFSEKYKDAQLESSGHTCNIGSEEYNQKLSERRAASVKAYLVGKGVAADRIATVGYGESRPMTDNKTRAGREQNRRVEVCTVLKVEKKVRVTE